MEYGASMAGVKRVAKALVGHSALLVSMVKLSWVVFWGRFGERNGGGAVIVGVGCIAKRRLWRCFESLARPHDVSPWSDVEDVNFVALGRLHWNHEVEEMEHVHY